MYHVLHVMSTLTLFYLGMKLIPSAVVAIDFCYGSDGRNRKSTASSCEWWWGFPVDRLGLVRFVFTLRLYVENILTPDKFIFAGGMRLPCRTP